MDCLRVEKRKRKKVRDCWVVKRRGIWRGRFVPSLLVLMLRAWFGVLVGAEVWILGGEIRYWVDGALWLVFLVGLIDGCVAFGGCLFLV